MIHLLNLIPVDFEAAISGEKRFCIRDNANLQVQRGDTAEFLECDPRRWCESHQEWGLYTGRKLLANITHVTNHQQRQNFVVFGFTIISGDEE